MVSEEDYQDLSVLDEPLRQLALAQMRTDIPVVTLTALANGDVIASIMKEAGGGSIPYARIDHLTRMLGRLPDNRAERE
jgi:hypothetical protein